MMRPVQLGWMDAITALGPDWCSTWAGLLAGRDGSSAWIPPSPAFAAPASVASIPHLDRHVDNLGHGPATRLLIEMSRRLHAVSSSVSAVYGASNHSETDTLIDIATTLADTSSPVAPSSRWWSLLVDPMPSSLLAAREGTWLSSACTSSMHALTAAWADAIESERTSAVLAADALSGIGVVGFSRVGAATQIDARPFCVDRAGLVIGEGVAAIRLDGGIVSQRPAIIGVGLSCDAGHPTDPNSEGTYLAKAIRDALMSSGLSASDVTGVVAHGTATRKNDEAEATAFRTVWNEAIPPVTSIKRGVGHTMGVAGLLNVMTAATALENGVLPPAIAIGEVMPSIDLVRGAPRPIARDGVLIALASGFGGNNAAVVISNR